MTITIGTVVSTVATVISESNSGLSYAVDVGSATNRGLVVIEVRGTNQTVDTLTYGAQNVLTGAVSGSTADSGGGFHANGYFIVPSATGSNTLTSTLSGSGMHGLFAIPLSADGALSAGGGAGATGSGSPITVNVTSAAGRLVIDAFIAGHSGGGSTTTVGASQTALIDAENFNGANSAGVSWEAGAATTTMSWTMTNPNGWAQAAMSISEAAAAGGGRILGSRLTESALLTGLVR